MKKEYEKGLGNLVKTFLLFVLFLFAIIGFSKKEIVSDFLILSRIMQIKDQVSLIKKEESQLKCESIEKEKKSSLDELTIFSFLDSRGFINFSRIFKREFDKENLKNPTRQYVLFGPLRFLEGKIMEEFSKEDRKLYEDSFAGDERKKESNACIKEVAQEPFERGEREELAQSQGKQKQNEKKQEKEMERSIQESNSKENYLQKKSLKSEEQLQLAKEAKNSFPCDFALKEVYQSKKQQDPPPKNDQSLATTSDSEEESLVFFEEWKERFGTQENPPPSSSSTSIWLKRISIRHRYGKQEDDCLPFASNYTTLELVLSPEYQVGHFLPFIDLQGHRFDDNTYAVNIALAARFISQVSSEILGFNVFYDYRQGCIGYYQQLGVGLEVLSSRWDLRANVYVPFGKRKHINVCEYNEYIGNYFATEKDIESISYSFSSEIGCLMVRSRYFLFYTAAGPYFIVRGTSSENTPGVEVRIRPQYRDFLAVDLSYRYDKLFKSIFQIGIIFNLPLYKISPQNLSSHGLSDRQIYQPIHRFEVMPLERKSCWEYNW